jgi:hypothetical protein
MEENQEASYRSPSVHTSTVLQWQVPFAASTPYVVDVCSKIAVARKIKDYV